MARRKGLYSGDKGENVDKREGERRVLKRGFVDSIVGYIRQNEREPRIYLHSCL